MKTMIPKIALALSAFAVVGASAQTYTTGQADQERRERNTQEAIAAWQAGNTSAKTTVHHSKHHTNHTTEAARQGGHEVAQEARHDTHVVAESAREVTHESAEAVREAGHKTAEEARHISDKADAKYGKPMDAGKANPEGINPAGVSSASPTAPSHGVTK